MEGKITDRKSIGEKYGDKKVKLPHLHQLMDKKPGTSAKYKEVTKVINSGKTINDVQVLSDQFITKRRNELFKRIKNTTIIKLIEENNNTESIYNLAEDNNHEDISNLKAEEDKSVYSHQTGLTNLTQATVKTTVTAVTYATEMLGNLVRDIIIIFAASQALLSFIILDLREKTDYDAYHIKEAMSYPGPNISRDKFLSEIINLVKLLYIYMCN